MPSPVLACNALAKSYHDGALQVDVLQNITLTIRPGECIAIVGSSGSGKSTLLHLLGGLDRPTSGEVWVDGQLLNNLSEHKLSTLRNHYLGFVYQFHHLLPEFTVLENVCLPLLIRGTSKEEAIAKATDLLTKVGLKNRLEHKLGEISGGERQRTAIARALVTNPKCLLADEPTGNLDHHTAAQVFELLLTLNKELSTSLVIVTHDLHLAQRLEHTYELIDGKLRS